MKKILIIWALLISVCYAQSKAGFFVVGGKLITVQDDNSRAYLKAVENSGVVPSVIQNMASNLLVTSEKAIGSYTLMTAQYPFIGGTAATHKFNLNNPLDTDGAFRLTFNGGGQSNDAFGYRNNTSGSFANTFLTSDNIGLNSNSVGIYLSTISNSGSGTLFGYIGFGSDYHLTYNTVAFFFRNNMSSNSGNVLNPYQNKKRMLQMVRTSSTNTSIYENENIVFSQTASSVAKPSAVPLYLGAYRNAGGRATDQSGYTIGFFYLSSNGLPANIIPQQSKIVTFYNSLLGRQ